jgi:hypothetical protein
MSIPIEAVANRDNTKSTHHAVHGLAPRDGATAECHAVNDTLINAPLFPWHNNQRDGLFRQAIPLGRGALERTSSRGAPKTPAR